MPESPELKHSRDVLRELIVGKQIFDLKPTTSGRYRTKRPDGLERITPELPAKVVGIDVKGKFMWWTLKSPISTWYMWCTYGMSGQWTSTQQKHTGFIVELNSNTIYFVDPRRFGTIKFVDNHDEHIRKLDSLGPSILEDSPMPLELFAKRILLKPNRTISEILMDQSCISGCGNYLKAEALFRAGISPHRDVIDLTSKEIYKLHKELLSSAQESYIAHGASIRTYKTVSEEVGSAQFQFKIYGKKSCPKSHEVVREETLDGRTSWWCNLCQK